MERELKETLVYFGEAGFFRSSSTTSEATIKPEDWFSLVASFSFTGERGMSIIIRICFSVRFTSEGGCGFRLQPIG